MKSYYNFQLSVKRRKTQIILCLAITCIVFCGIQANAFSDAIFWQCNYPSRTFSLHDITCVQEVSCKKTQLRCSKNNKTLFTAQDFAETIVNSDDGNYLVGLSNLGSENAFWVRTVDGNVIAFKPHNDGEIRIDNGKGGTKLIPAHSAFKLHYCTESVTNVREWYDRENPDVKFRTSNGELAGVSVTGCDGKRVELVR